MAKTAKKSPRRARLRDLVQQYLTTVNSDLEPGSPHRVTIKKLAAWCEVSRQHFYNILAGRVASPAHHVAAFAMALDTTEACVIHAWEATRASYLRARGKA